MDDQQNQTQSQAQDELKAVAETIKIGEEEFNLEDAKHLVQLGKIGKEAEEKFKTPLDKVWPKTQQVINENKELRDRIEQNERNAIQAKQEMGQTLTPEEAEKSIRSELRKHGAVLQEDIDQLVNEKFSQTKQADKLLTEVNSEITGLKKDFGIDTDDLKVLEYMRETGLNTPKAALKQMFEAEIDKIKEARLADLKPKGLTTMDSSQAGSKEPSDVKLTKNNLQSNLHEFLESIKNTK